MVNSIINPTNINYSENKIIDNDDIEFSTTIYDYSIYSIEIEIALGKEKYTYSKPYGVIYFSIYLIVNMEPVSRIGIYEIKSEDFINAFDENGNIDFNYGNIIIFETEENIKNFLNINNNTENEEFLNDENIEVSDIEEIPDEDDVLRINLNNINPNNSEVVDDINNKLEEGIFIIDETNIAPPLIPEETEKDSDNMKSNYKGSIHNSWVSRFTKNNEFNIIDNEGSGDCFFAVIRDAFKQIGYNTTVDKLRAIVSKNANETIFNEYKTLYADFAGELQNIHLQIKDTKNTLLKLKKRIENNNITKNDHNILLETAKQSNGLLQELLLSKTSTQTLLNEFAFMKGIENLEQFREIILTSQFWADSWAITTLERVLNIKVIILSYESYNNDDFDGIMQCGENISSSTSIKNPDYYIITSYTGKHYTLIEYKKKRIFKFTEIPYDIKMMIINKCLERNAGTYYLINDFRDFKIKLGLDSNYGEPNSSEDDYMNKDLYDNSTIFSIYRQSNPKPKPGKGTGELIIPSNIIKYSFLNTNNTENICYDWRRKLDDHWMKSPFSIDGKKWASVKHYTLGSQYKKGFPDFYLNFSLDSDSDISKDIDLAIAATSKSGKHKDKILRPVVVKPDPDYYEYGINNRYEIERKTALESKFSQNPDLFKILNSTYPAKIIIYVRGKDHIVDNLLMQLRKSNM
jgi:hypothetical protein